MLIFPGFGTKTILMPILEAKTTIIIQTTVPFEKKIVEGSNQIISQQNQIISPQQQSQQQQGNQSSVL